MQINSDGKFHNMQKQLKTVNKYICKYVYLDKATNQSTSTATEIERDRDMRWGRRRGFKISTSGITM
jgi:hypothetical protein